MTALLLVFASAALSAMILILLSNLRSFPGLNGANPSGSAAKVSVLVPARNEAGVIGASVHSLLRQSHSRLELLVLDDDSDDGTDKAAVEASKNDERMRIIRGEPIPDGWLAKNWACQQLAELAVGEILVFADADVHWQPHALDSLLYELVRTDANMLAVMPTQRTESWPERLCVPLMALAIHAYLPAVAVHRSNHPLLAAANGQCIAFNRAAYDSIGGHAAVRGNILDDIGLARRAKRAGLRLRMVEADGLITCRMYTDWQSVREGYAKNMLAGFGGAAGLIAGAVFHWVVFLVPWALLGLGFAGVSVPWHPFWALFLVCATLLVRGISSWRTGQRVGDALLLPVSVLLMTVIAGQSLWWHWRHGGPIWKGRRAVA